MEWLFSYKRRSRHALFLLASAQDALLGSKPRQVFKLLALDRLHDVINGRAPLLQMGNGIGPILRRHLNRFARFIAGKISHARCCGEVYWDGGFLERVIGLPLSFYLRRGLDGAFSGRRRGVVLAKARAQT